MPDLPDSVSVCACVDTSVCIIPSPSPLLSLTPSLSLSLQDPTALRASLSKYPVSRAHRLSLTFSGIRYLHSHAAFDNIHQTAHSYFFLIEKYSIIQVHA